MTDDDICDAKETLGKYNNFPKTKKKKTLSIFYKEVRKSPKIYIQFIFAR